MKHSLPLNEKWLDSQALKLVKKLQSHNHDAYLVGGCVRDLLTDLPPKDFDIATSALPEEVNKIIRPSHLIGRRFKLVLVKKYGVQYEISTFRGKAEPDEDDPDGPIMDDNTFGSMQEDAHRRDFTINSFFYDPVKCELFDYCDGLSDIKKRVVRMIGDPKVRIQEDPLRMLRAVRFAHKARFTLEENLRATIFELAEQLEVTVLPRKREELLKFLRLPSAGGLLWECHDLNLLKYLSPSLEDTLVNQDADLFMMSLGRGLSCVSNKSNPSELFAVLLFSMINAKHPDFCEKLSLKNKQIEALSEILKNEWGMFRNEQELFFQTLEFIKKLQDINTTGKMRERYKTHLTKSNSLSIAITLCNAYKLLPEPELLFWTKLYWEHH